MHQTFPFRPVALMLLLGAVIVYAASRSQHNAHPDRSEGYSGSVSCRECHERFYRLWSQSNHGLAMQPFTDKLAATLPPLPEPIQIGPHTYTLRLKSGAHAMIQDGPDGLKELPIVHAMGGKNTYNFLTPYRGGRLQVMPLSFDVKRKRWYDTTKAMIRHGLDFEDEPLPWTDPMLTFNTACYGCHVSQLARNYDPASDSYKTEWREPGISCESCHGPGAEHVRVCREAPKGYDPKDMKTLRWSTLTKEQKNHACSTCHAKMSPLTDGMPTGAHFFDHYDLVTLEDRDYFPDGRDLGENYSYTSWRMSPCVKSGLLDCMHCHTSSGRYRFKGKEVNNACLPCHAKRVANATAHTHHKASSKGNHCVSCHMPMTEFGRMNRSDHSMRPPAPSATMAFGSPNACNLCHKKKSPEWADKYVRQWRSRDYQAQVLALGTLVLSARKRDWSKLDAILAYIGQEDRDEVIATSLIRLLQSCPEIRKLSVLEQVLKNDESPLVRSAAAAALQDSPRPESIQALAAATTDKLRLVRLRAAGALLTMPENVLNKDEQTAVKAATAELLASYKTRLDQWGNHYNLGNFYLARGQLQKAASAYQQAHTLRPDVILPLVNLAQTQARLGLSREAEDSLRKAMKIEPRNAAVRFNLGLISGEKGSLKEAEAHLRAAIEADSSMASAYYNLGIVQRQLGKAEGFAALQTAVRLAPDSAKMLQGLVSFLIQDKQEEAALAALDNFLKRNPGHMSTLRTACSLLARKEDRQGIRQRLERALQKGRLAPAERAILQRELKNLLSD